MKNYQLIAFDMDGTLLNNQKAVTPDTVSAIARASAAGKTVILNTGRGPAELAEFELQLPSVRYYNCISGALVYDCREKVAIASCPLETEIARSVLRITSAEDVMPQMINVEAMLLDSDDLLHLEKYQMSVYRKSYEQNATLRENLAQQYIKDPFPLYKLNLYHTDIKARERNYKRLLEAHLPVQIVFAESTSLEISPSGVHKGTGLTLLCSHLGIPLSETIVVGDADNDLKALETGGLAVAMGNANAHVKAVCDYIVADNNHDGCAEAIDRYLLNIL